MWISACLLISEEMLLFDIFPHCLHIHPSPVFSTRASTAAFASIFEALLLTIATDLSVLCIFFLTVTPFPFSSMFSVQGFFKEMFWNSKMYTIVEIAYGSDLLPVDKHKKLIANTVLLNVISKYTNKASYSALYGLNYHDC